MVVRCCYFTVVINVTEFLAESVLDPEEVKRAIKEKDVSKVLLNMFNAKESETRCRSASCILRLVQDGKFTH